MPHGLRLTARSCPLLKGFLMAALGQTQTRRLEPGSVRNVPGPDLH